MKPSIQIAMNGSYKLGMNEVVGLEQAIQAAFQPVLDQLNEQESWSGDGWFKLEPVEYARRDGFIPHSHNCGGLAIDSIIPKCGESAFSCLEFGECDGCYGDGDEEKCCAEMGGECAYECDGHLDARLRIWFKFEGFDKETGELAFYINASGGNTDAPYFRNTPTIFEASFTCKSVAGVSRAANKHIKALMKVLSK